MKLPREAALPVLILCIFVAATLVVVQTSSAQKKSPEKSTPEKTPSPSPAQKELLTVLPAPAQTNSQEKPSTKIQLPEGGVDDKTPIITNTDLITFNVTVTD